MDWFNIIMLINSNRNEEFSESFCGKIIQAKYL